MAHDLPASDPREFAAPDGGCCQRGAGASGDPGLLAFRIPGLDCPVEEGQIRRVLEGLPGIGRLDFDLGRGHLQVEAPSGRREAIREALQGAGFQVEVEEAPVLPGARAASLRRPALALGAGLLAEALAWAAPAGGGWKAAGMLLSALAIAGSGSLVFRKGLASLRRGRLTISTLMALAVTGAFLIGEWPEAAVVMALYALAEAIEARAVEGARHAIQALFELAPQEVESLQPDGSWLRGEAGEVPLGARVRVRPGERIALDGRIVAGASAVDQACVTGESLPVEKGPGDPVFAGTLNHQGALEYETTAPASDTLLARIIRTVESAEASRAPVQRTVDRFAEIYTPAVFAGALLVALGGPLLAGIPWTSALYKALVLLVISCPCALVLSTPVTLVSALAAATRRGLLIKGGAHLEQARRIRLVALDKTGTLTAGQPRLVAWHLLDRAQGSPAPLEWAASLGQASGHPVSRALAEGLGPRGRHPVADLSAEPGRGVRGRIQGRSLCLGSARWIREQGACTQELEAWMADQEAQGRSISLLADSEGALAAFAVADTPRPEAAQAVAELEGLGVRTVMLTGDNPGTAARVAAKAGIREVRAGLLPQGKLEALRELALAAGPVAMVGDGINDAPALAAAQLGFAMGHGGTHAAMEAADVVLMNDDLRKVAETIRLSRRTHAVLWQNILAALGIKVLFLALALLGAGTLWMAVFADMGASLLVVFNGLRMLRPGPQG